MSENQAQSPLEIAQSLEQYWSPKIIAEVDDNFVKVAKLKGSFVWHSHEQEDEMFMVLKGQLDIEFTDRVVHLKTGDIFVIEAGVEHNPVANEECLVMLFESKMTRHTGNVEHEKSRSIEEQILM